jgi:hypothetical protein
MTREELRALAIDRAKEWMGTHPDAYNRCTHWCGSFFARNTDQSMTRLIMLILAVAVLIPLGAAAYVATRPHLTQWHAAVITALAGMVTALVWNGIVAIRNRNSSSEPPPSPPSSSPESPS